MRVGCFRYPNQNMIADFKADFCYPAVFFSGKDYVDVPTIAESGYADFETTAWWGVFAPRDLPARLAAELAADVERIVRSETFRGKLEPLGVLPTALTGNAFAEFQRAELAKWGKAVRDSGATAE